MEAVIFRHAFCMALFANHVREPPAYGRDLTGKYASDRADDA